MTLNQLFGMSPWTTTTIPTQYQDPNAPVSYPPPQVYQTPPYYPLSDWMESDAIKALKMRLDSEDRLIVELTKCLAEVENELARRSILDRIEAAEARKIALQLAA